MSPAWIQLQPTLRTAGRPAAGQQLHDEGDSLQAVMHVRTNSRLMALAVQHHTADALRCPAWRGPTLCCMAHAGGPIQSVAQKGAPDHDSMTARAGAKHDARPWRYRATTARRRRKPRVTKGRCARVYLRAEGLLLASWEILASSMANCWRGFFSHFAKN